MAETKTRERAKASLPAPSEKSLDTVSEAPPAPAAMPPIPGLQKRNLFILGGAVLALWATAFASGSKIFVGVVLVLTVALAGMLIYVFRWAKKQREVLALLQSASGGKDARKAALEKIAAKGDKSDVSEQLVKAQLEAQDDPDLALATLEKIDIKKAPAQLQDDARAMKAQLYLVKDRIREARELADEITVTNATDPNARGMLAAVVAEAWGRTGKHNEALALLSTFSPEDKDFEKAKVPLLFARVYSAFAANKRDMVRRDMKSLMAEDLNFLARFANPGAKVHPELQKMARELLQSNPEVRKMVQKNQNRAQRRAR